MPSHLDSIFWSIFHRFLFPTSISWTLKIIVFPKVKLRFLKKSIFEVGIEFFSMLVPTCMHFSFKNPSKSFQKSFPRCIVFSIDFCIDFLSIFLRFGRATWSHVGHIFVLKSAALLCPQGVLCWVYLFLGFFGRPGCLLASSGVDLGGFGRPFLEVFGATLALCWSIFFIQIWFGMKNS